MVLIKVENHEGINIKEDEFSPFYFVLYGDIQYGLIRNNKGWCEERNLLKQAIEKTNKLTPPIVIALGDLCNEKDMGAVKEQQYEDLKNDLNQLNENIHLYVFSGNHDLGDTPTYKSIEYYERIWGDCYYKFIYNNCLFIILNSCVFYNESKTRSYKEKQLQWFEDCLKKSEKLNVKHKFLFMHHPLMYDDINEGENIGLIYFNKIQAYIEKRRFHISKKNRMAIYNLIKKYNITYVFCGHNHFNKVNKIDERTEQIIVSAVGMQCKDDDSGILIVTVKEKDIDYKYYSLQYIPNEIGLC